MTSRSRSWALAALVVPVVALAACSSSSSSPTTTRASATTTTTTPSSSTAGSAPSSTTTTSAGSTIATIPVADRSPAGTWGTAPDVTVPSGTPPTTLQAADLITGTGKEAEAGDSVTVQYVLATYSSGKVVQSSWTSQPFTFTLGEGQVIKGWDEGVVGMRVGGRRELIIPASLGYGDQSPGSGIAANDTLVFVIDLQKVSS